MFPEEFIRRIKTQQYIDDELLLRSLAEPSPVSIRINSIKWGKIPAGSDRVPWCNEGWYLKQRPSFTFDPLFHAGCYYPQEASGMFTGEVFRQVTSGSSGLKVLDLCGAPGGKSTHISSLLGNNGFIVANEVIKSRARILADNITRWGIGNTMVTCNDPSAFSTIFGYFDVILVDAPCSGEGMFRDRIAVNEWSVSNTVLCAERQKRILLDAWPALREGGILIYSTCTFNPAENEEQVKWLMDTRQAESVTIDTGLYDGIKEIEYYGIKGYGFYPGLIRGEGFFISAIKKIDNEDSAGSGKNKTRFIFNLKEDRKKVAGWLKHEPGTILRDENTVYTIPVTAEEYEVLCNQLNIIKKGTELFTEKNRDIIPSHELVISELFSGNIIPSIELPLSGAINFLRKEQLKDIPIPVGWAVVKYLGINIGLIKNIGARINNYFPVEWRIRMNPERDKTKEIISWIN